MRTLTTFLALFLLIGAATGANPAPVIATSGKTNGTNTVVVGFELSNNGAFPVTVSPIAELTINGTVIAANDISWSNFNGKINVTARGVAVPLFGKVKVKIKANLNGGGTTGTTEQEVEFKKSINGTGGEVESES
ncbi:MAG: hypothetical protein MUF18_04670 [Fimbriiglobus sp.]|jgi:hypothetical protein|nr:hypothetical protein [Fimbriiglobus sp.]